MGLESPWSVSAWFFGARSAGGDHAPAARSLAQRLGLDVVAHVELINELAIGVAVHHRVTRKANPLPPNYVIVAAVERIGEEPLEYVLAEHREELRGGHCRKGVHRALFQRVQHVILLARL